MENLTIIMNSTSRHYSHHVQTNLDLISAAFFILISLKWYFPLLFPDPRPRPVARIASLSSLIPWSGLVGLLGPGLAILLTIMDTRENSLVMSEMVTIYLSFSLSGIIDLIIQLKKNILPHHAHTVSLLLTFMVELIVLADSEIISSSDASRHCLMMTVMASLTCCLAHLVSRNTSSSWYFLCLATLTMVQGTWTIHNRLLSSEERWAKTYFSWHLLTVFSLHHLLIIIFRYITFTFLDLLPPSTSTNSSPSSFSTELSKVSPSPLSGVGQIKTFEEIFDNSRVEKINSVLQSIDKMVAGSDTSDSSTDTFTEEVDLIMGDKSKQDIERVSPLEEFNTLHRNVSTIRASIKLKESNIV